MKKQRELTWVELAILVIGIGFCGWVWNAVKLASCDFVSPCKCEVIHGAGLIVPPLSIATVWFDDDGA